jgi:molybdopterin molybdotransferase
MPGVFRAAGGDIHAMKIAMKPGKPLAIGRMNDAIYIGLPGNPVAAYIGWLTIGAPIARSAAGFAVTNTGRSFVRMERALSRQPGRREFRPARIIGRDAGGLPLVELLGSTFSARIAMLCSADGLAVIPAESAQLEAGTTLEYIQL